MNPDIEIRIKQQEELWLIQLSGELTRLAETDIFATFPWNHPQTNVNKILFDMSAMKYMNSAGIALLIRYVREARQRGFSTYAFGVSAHYQKIFKIVGLTSYIELFPDQYSAVETLRMRSAYESHN